MAVGLDTNPAGTSAPGLADWFLVITVYHSVHPPDNGRYTGLREAIKERYQMEYRHIVQINQNS